MQPITCPIECEGTAICLLDWSQGYGAEGGCMDIYAARDQYGIFIITDISVHFTSYQTHNVNNETPNAQDFVSYHSYLGRHSFPFRKLMFWWYPAKSAIFTGMNLVFSLWNSVHYFCLYLYFLQWLIIVRQYQYEYKTQWRLPNGELSLSTHT